MDAKMDAKQRAQVSASLRKIAKEMALISDALMEGPQEDLFTSPPPPQEDPPNSTPIPFEVAGAPPATDKQIKWIEDIWNKQSWPKHLRSLPANITTAQASHYIRMHDTDKANKAMGRG